MNTKKFSEDFFNRTEKASYEREMEKLQGERHSKQRTERAVNYYSFVGQISERLEGTLINNQGPDSGNPRKGRIWGKSHRTGEIIWQTDFNFKGSARSIYFNYYLRRHYLGSSNYLRAKTYEISEEASPPVRTLDPEKAFSAFEQRVQEISGN